MDTEAVAIYFICDEATRCPGSIDDPQCAMSTAEVMTFAVMAVLHYRGDYCLTRSVARTGRYFTKMLGHSRLVRRIHQIPEPLWLLVIQVLRLYLRKPHERYFIVDSFPGKTYENHKSFRSRLFPGKEYHGYTQ